MSAQETTAQSGADIALLRTFNIEIKSRVPHLSNNGVGSTIINETPLLDITRDLIECGRVEYGLNVTGKNLKVYGKLESSLPGGSVKVRPAVQIIEDAIVSGKLRQQTTVFEATSGNFGIALGLMRRLGVDIVVLVSKKLQDGVLQELSELGVKTLNLSVDICPTPGLGAEVSALAASAMASSVGIQLAHNGFDMSVFEDSRSQIERLLERGDAINLAKFLAEIYGGFCPEQYDNEMNVKAHEMLTGPEIEQQLEALGDSLAEFEVVCTFGSGGTSAGLSRYVHEKFGMESVHVVFPLSKQDVAGIRTKENALGLKFYKPEAYAGQHEVDFEVARRILTFFARKGYDIGESSALALYATLQMAINGVGNRFVVILADGIGKYREGIEIGTEADRSLEVAVHEAGSNLSDLEGVLWTHPIFAPTEKGIRLIASSLGCDKEKVVIAGGGDVERLYMSHEMTEDFRKLLPNEGKKLLLLCMNGSTSLTLARHLSRGGVKAVSLAGGMVTLATAAGEEASELVELARG